MGFVVLEVLQSGICEVALWGVALLLGLLEVFALF